MTLFGQAMAPFEHIEMDQMGPFVQSDAGNRYINVIVDKYSKYIVAWANKSITGEAFATGFYEHFLSIYSSVRIISSDNHACYISEVFEALCNYYGIDRRKSSVMRPQTQGLVERTNRFIITTLRSFVHPLTTKLFNLNFHPHEVVSR